MQANRILDNGPGTSYIARQHLSELRRKAVQVADEPKQLVCHCLDQEHGMWLPLSDNGNTVNVHLVCAVCSHVIMHVLPISTTMDM